MTLARLPDWENRLGRELALWRKRPFRWDRDCARYFAACVEAQTGVDPLGDLRGKYRTKREALKLLAAKPMSEYLDERFERIPAALAQRGDCALMQDTCLGCVLGGEAMFFLREGGMTMVPRAEWTAVWMVAR